VSLSEAKVKFVHVLGIDLYSYCCYFLYVGEGKSIVIWTRLPTVSYLYWTPILIDTSVYNTNITKFSTGIADSDKATK